MSELILEIEELYDRGYTDAEIARKLKLPESIVEQVCADIRQQTREVDMLDIF